MKLLNHTMLYLSGALFLIIGVWAVIFYVNMLDEVYDSIDDGLDNYKLLIVQKAKADSSVLRKHTFDESNYAIREIRKEQALRQTDRHFDSLLYMENEGELEPVRVLRTVFATDRNTYHELTIVSSMVEEDDLIEDLLYALIWLYAALLISIFLVNNFLLRRIWKPFYALIEQLKQFSLRSSRAFSPPPSNVREFKALNAAIEAMLQETVDTYNSQKQFIENASHELQTPLAISINRLELMLEDAGDNEEQSKALAEVIRNLERLSRLNQSLLLLTKIENRQFAEEETVDFNALMHQQLAEFEELIAYRHISVSLEESGSFSRQMNKDLATILLGNLLKNAIVHNHSEGRLLIRISEQSLRIANTGDSRALDPQKLFTRFYKASTHKSSTGLGLAIVKTIATRYGLEVGYRYHEGLHEMQLHV